MEKLLLNDGTEISIAEGSSLSVITTNAQDYADVGDLAACLTLDNLSHVKFLSDDIVTCVYKNMALCEPHFAITTQDDGILQVIFRLREKTAVERHQDATQTAITYLTDAQAYTVKELYPEWSPKKAYTTGERYRHDNVLYKCLQDHHGQADWTPDSTPSLWALVLIPIPSEVPDWVQPDSTNPYSVGDRLRHSGKIWESLVDGNVWEPGVEGTDSLWKLIR